MTATAVNYPVKYQPLLIKAGLIGSGVKVIQAYHSDKKRTTLDETSNTWTEMDEYEIDYREANEYVAPYQESNGSLAGDWRKGLTADEIRIISTECGVTAYEPNSIIRLYHGKRFDLSNPRDMADYRIVIATNVLALANNVMVPGQRFYITSHDDEMRSKEAERSALREAILMSERFSNEEKRDLLLLLSYELKLGLSTNLSEEEVRDNFAELAYSPKTAKRVTGIFRMEDKNLRLLLHQCIDRNILFCEGDRGTITRPNGTVLAYDWESMLDVIKTDSAIRSELQRKLSGGQLEPVNVGKLETKALDLGLVKSFDTNIRDISDVAFWPAEACAQYLKEQGVQHTLTETDSVDKWRKVVEQAHMGLEPSVIHVPEKLSEKAQLVERMNTVWSRDQCKAWAEEVAKLGFNQYELPQGNASTSVWRDYVTALLKSMNEEQLAKIKQ